MSTVILDGEPVISGGVGGHNGGGGAGPDVDDKAYRKKLNELIKHDPLTGMYRCTGCLHASTHRRTVVNHVESAHLQLREYTCEFCPRKFFNRNAVSKHTSRKHGNEKMQQQFFTGAGFVKPDI